MQGARDGDTLKATEKGNVTVFRRPGSPNKQQEAGCDITTTPHKGRMGELQCICRTQMS